MARAQRRNRPILDNVFVALQRSGVPLAALEAEMTRTWGVAPIPSLPILTPGTLCFIHYLKQKT